MRNNIASQDGRVEEINATLRALKAARVGVPFISPLNSLVWLMEDKSDSMK